MKKFRDGLMAVILIAGLIGFIGYDFLTPVKGNAEEKAVKKEAKAAKDTKATTKAAAPAKKVVKKEPASEITVATPVATLGKKVSVDIMGAGFDTDEEVRVLFTDDEGMQTDIGYALEPAPKGNKSGAWMTTWAVDEFIKAGLVKAGVYTLTVTNNEFKPLAQTAIVFKAAPPAKPPADKEGKAEKGEKKEK
jgi:hypothetical protein